LCCVLMRGEMKRESKEGEKGEGNKCTLLGYQRERLREAVCIYHYTV
jgi:hypothetical protein